MGSLLARLASALDEVLPVTEESDGALTVRHAGTLASLRVVPIVADLDLVSLTQVVAWDLALTKKLRDLVAERAQSTPLGSLVLTEKPPAASTRKTADVMLRYNFPGTGLTDEALRTMVLMVLDKGAEIREAITGL